MLPHRHKTRLSYADLLDLYIQQESSGDEADIDVIARSLGFKYSQNLSTRNGQQAEKQTNETNKEIAEYTHDSLNTVPDSRPSDRPDLPFYYIAKRERTEAHSAQQVQELPTVMQVTSLDDDDIYDENAKIPHWQPLTRQPKLWAKLRQILNQNYNSQEPDIPRLLKNIEQGDSPKIIPFTQRKRRISQLLVLADYSDHLRTARNDYQQLQKDLIAYWGKGNIQWQSMLDYPGGKVGIYQKRHYQKQKWRIPSANTAILILSDCGSFSSNELRQQWQTLLRQINQAGNTTLILAPASANDLLKVNFKNTHCYSWDYTLPRVNNTYSEVTQEASIQTQKDIEAILTYLCFTYRIEPQLLRATRQCLQLDVGIETACRLHEDITDDGECIYLKKQCLSKYRDKFRFLETKQQNQAIDLVYAAHAPYLRSMLDYELVTVQALRPDKSVTGADESLLFLQRLCKTFIENPRDKMLQSHAYTMLEEQERGGEEAASLFVTLHRDKIEKGEIGDVKPPKNVALEDIARFIDISQSGTVYTLLQRGDEMVLSERIENDRLNPSTPFRLGETVFTRRMVELQLKIVTINNAAVFPLPSNQSVVTINTGTENLTLATLTKPDWADNIGRDPQGLFIECQHQGQSTRVYYPEWGGELDQDEYGVYTELAFNDVVQRFRYIPAGQFLMGSPASEKERFSSEQPHEVTLSQGYWLADTACTQALWQAVVGANPANFKEDIQNPVEQVSWEDVQDFLKKLNTLIPQLKAKLPSEAQWEYACRAGTSTPFSFGENITPEQVNYDGGFPYADGKKGEDRKKTVPVKALPANQWGLYQMHGNVWEWCQDGYGDYPAEPVQDPSGAEQENRVVRGGSWILPTGGACVLLTAPGPRLTSVTTTLVSVFPLVKQQERR